MVIAVILPDLALRAALKEAQDRLGEAIALAPQHDSIQVIGDVSEPARRLGVRPGMGLGEAIDICPSLLLVPPDPTRAAALWEKFLLRLEDMGAEVESPADGEAFFEASGLERLYGNLAGVIETVRQRLGPSVRIGAASSRLASLAAARLQEPGRPAEVVSPEETRGFLSGLPVAILVGRVEAGDDGRAMANSLVRLGIHRLGQLAELQPDAVADRFGRTGIEARDMALGFEDRIRPRSVHEEMVEEIDLPEAGSGIHLAGALNILSGRIGSRLEKQGRTARRLCLEADLIDGGSWVHETSPRQPSARAELLRMILAPGLEMLPRPAEKLRLRVSAFAPGHPEQIEIKHQPEQNRRLRLSEAASQVEAAVGQSGLMRVLDAEPDSHLPERRMLLTPYLAKKAST